MQDVPIHVSELQHHSVHVVRRTLGHHLRRQWTATHNIILCTSWNACERIGRRRVPIIRYTYNNYYYYAATSLSVSLTVSSVKFSRLTRTDLNNRRHRTYTHHLRTVPETFPQSYFEQWSALDRRESRSFLIFISRRCREHERRWIISGFF